MHLLLGRHDYPHLFDTSVKILGYFRDNIVKTICGADDFYRQIRHHRPRFCPGDAVLPIQGSHVRACITCRGSGEAKMGHAGFCRDREKPISPCYTGDYGYALASLTRRTACGQTISAVGVVRVLAHALVITYDSSKLCHSIEAGTLKKSKG